MTRNLLVFAAALLPLAATAQTIYKCTDAGGGTLISNTRVDKSCRPIVMGQESVAPPSAPASRPRSSTASPSPADFPRVQEGAQKARDNDRRLILEQELASEQRALEQAKRELQAQESVRGPGNPAERVAPYQDRVAQHERNIQALQKELSALR